MIKASLGDKVANVFNWLITPEKSFDFSQSNKIYFGNGRIVSLDELAERCLTHESIENMFYEMNDQGYCIHCDPRFHEFMLNLTPRTLE